MADTTSADQVRSPDQGTLPLDLSRSGPPAIVVVGRTGAGKSTLLNTIFGKDVVETGTRSDVTLGISKHVVQKTSLTLYDTPGAGGMDDNAEAAMRRFLQLEVPVEKRKSIAADVVVFLFTHDRISRMEFDFFQEVNSVYGPRLLLVKNYKASDSQRDLQTVLELIEARCGKRALPVDAKTGTGVSELIGEVVRLLPMQRVLAFNRSLSEYRQRAATMAKEMTRKTASVASVTRATKADALEQRLAELIKDLVRNIGTAFEDDLRLDLQNPARPAYLTEDATAEASGRALVGGVGAALVGFLIDPILGLFMALFGGLLGAGTTPKRLRGGSASTVQILAYGRAVTRLLDLAIQDPHVYMTRNVDVFGRWLESHKGVFQSQMDEAVTKAERLVEQASLTAFLNQPNTTDSAVVEWRLSPVVDGLFV